MCGSAWSTDALQRNGAGRTLLDHIKGDETKKINTSVVMCHCFLWHKSSPQIVISAKGLVLTETVCHRAVTRRGVSNLLIIKEPQKFSKSLNLHPSAADC